MKPARTTTKTSPEKTAEAPAEKLAETPATRSRLALYLGLGTLLATALAILALTRPVETPDRPTQLTGVVRQPGELPAARDEAQHFAPGSPSAVAEQFLRAWQRAHYEDAAALSTGAMKRRCERNLTEVMHMDPETRESLRLVQVGAEAAQFDLERAVVNEMPPGERGVARRQVRGMLHAHGPLPDGRMVESQREQTLDLELIDGAWRVASWTPTRGDAGITVH